MKKKSEESAKEQVMKRFIKDYTQKVDDAVNRLEPVVKVYSDDDLNILCTQAKSGKFLLIDWDDDDSPFRTEVYDSIPDDLTNVMYLTWNEVMSLGFKWLFFGIGELDDNENQLDFEFIAETRKKDDERISAWIENGWQMVFPISYGRVYLFNPPMFYKPLDEKEG